MTVYEVRPLFRVPHTSECFAREKGNDLIDRHDLLQDHPKDQGEELAEINLTDEGEEAQPVFVSTSLTLKLKKELLGLLREHKDIFAWTYPQ